MTTGGRNQFGLLVYMAASEQLSLWSGWRRLQSAAPDSNAPATGTAGGLLNGRKAGRLKELCAKCMCQLGTTRGHVLCTINNLKEMAHLLLSPTFGTKKKQALRCLFLCLGFGLCRHVAERFSLAPWTAVGRVAYFVATALDGVQR